MKLNFDFTVCENLAEFVEKHHISLLKRTQRASGLQKLSTSYSNQICKSENVMLEQ